MATWTPVVPDQTGQAQYPTTAVVGFAVVGLAVVGKDQFASETVSWTVVNPQSS